MPAAGGHPEFVILSLPTQNGESAASPQPRSTAYWDMPRFLIKNTAEITGGGQGVERLIAIN